LAAALLTNITHAFHTLVDSKDLDTLHHLMVEFISTSLDLRAKDHKVQDVLSGVITTYVPEYMGNQMLHWSGQYWEQSHPIPSNRPKAKDLVNPDLEKGLDELLVSSLIKTNQTLGEQVGLDTGCLYDITTKDPGSSNIDTNAYPNGDSSIPNDAIGTLLLFVHSISKKPDTSKILHCGLDLENHQLIVDLFLDDAAFSVVDAVIFTGMLAVKNFDVLQDINNLNDSETTGFLRYLQVHPSFPDC
jgi:hypothetical protein